MTVLHRLGSVSIVLQGTVRMESEGQWRIFSGNDNELGSQVPFPTLRRDPGGGSPSSKRSQKEVGYRWRTRLAKSRHGSGVSSAIEHATGELQVISTRNIRR